MSDTIHWQMYERDLHDRTRRYFGSLHQRLRQQKVLVIGAGAVGTEVLKNLAMLGVGTIHLVDFDKASLSNLNRCIFFRPEDHDATYKVNAIAREIKAIWQDTTIIPYPMTIQDAPEHVWNVPLIIVAVDNNEARHYINLRSFCCTPRPFVINGAMGRTFVETQILLPGYTSCMVCTWSRQYFDELFRRIVRENCDQFFYKTREFFPAISVLNSIIGGIMASEAVKILIGLERWQQEGKWEDEHIPQLGYALRYDIGTHESFVGKIIPNPDCVEVFCRDSRRK